MRELRIELPNYDGRREDVNTITALVSQYNLEYDALVSPILTVTDTSTDEVVLTSQGVMRCYVSGDPVDVGRFLAALEAWFKEF